MKNSCKICAILLICLSLHSFDLHKFYVGIYQIDFVSEKKMLQITSRIFIDDLNDVLTQKYNVKTHLGDKNERPEDVVLMKKYISENFGITINNVPKTLEFKSKELENNIMICYFVVRDVNKIRSMAIKNSVLMDLHSEQQNIIQTTLNGHKKSTLLTLDNHKAIFN